MARPFSQRKSRNANHAAQIAQPKSRSANRAVQIAWQHTSYEAEASEEPPTIETPLQNNLAHRQRCYPLSSTK